MNPVLFSSASQHWATPAEVMRALDDEFSFTLDPCPLNGKRDGLDPALSWGGHRVYCNPPYGPAIADWLNRAPEAELAVYLLPARTDTRWFHDLVLPSAREIRFCRGRLRFNGATENAPFPSMIVVFARGTT